MDFETLNLINLLLTRPTVFLFDSLIMLDATQRQVIYRLEKLNDFLMSNNQTNVVLGENKEFQVHDNTRQFLLDYLYDHDLETDYYMNRQERKKYIYLMLFIDQEYLSLQHFMGSLNVSKSTLLQDMKELSEMLIEENIVIVNDRINGYQLIGPERLIRKNMMNIILEFVGVAHNVRVLNLFLYNHNLETIESMKLLIEKLSIKYGIVFVEDRLNEFIYIFIMIKNRISSRKSVSNLYNDIPKIELMNTFKEYNFTKELLSYFYEQQVDDYEMDIQYLTSWIIGVSVGDVLEDSADLLFIGELVEKIVKRFEVVSGVQFYDVETIYRHIFSHFRPAYYRLLFKHPIINPLSQTVKSEYNELYKLVSETMRPISDIFDSEIPPEELAYLTLHFMPAYKSVRKSTNTRLKGLIICLNGVGSSAILYNELGSMFPEFDFYKPLEASKIDFDKYQPDIIFTTHFFKGLLDVETPIVKVAPVMDNIIRYQVIQEANIKLGLEKSEAIYLEGLMNVIKNHFGEIEDESQLKTDILNVLQFSKRNQAEPDSDDSLKLIEMISRDLIVTHIDASDWREAVLQSGQPLVDHGYVKQSYIDHIVAMHDSEVRDFVLIPQLALPHTRPEHGSLKHGISIGILTKPVSFGETNKLEVKYIFVLSAPDNYRHLNAMSEFLSLIDRKDFFEVLESNDIDLITSDIEFIHSH